MSAVDVWMYIWTPTCLRNQTSSYKAHGTRVTDGSSSTSTLPPSLEDAAMSFVNLSALWDVFIILSETSLGTTLVQDTLNGIGPEVMTKIKDLAGCDGCMFH